MVQPRTRYRSLIRTVRDCASQALQKLTTLYTGTTTRVFNYYKRDMKVTAALVRQGVIPCAPIRQSVVFTIRLLELYRLAHLRCPHLAIHPWVKALCDLHGVHFSTYLYEQFSIAFDLYLAIRAIVQKRIQAALDRDKADFRLRHVCPACTYKLEGEGKLVFDILATMDGNDSLKRVLRREKVETAPEDGTPTVGASKERTDLRDGRGDYFLSREEVNAWSRARLEELMGTPPVMDDDDDGNLCAERWKNMVYEITAKMWGIFDETGLFLALCRHGFVLLAADMVQSGELCVIYIHNLLFQPTDLRPQI